MMQLSKQRLDRALLSLKGLSVGDAFGERFFLHPNVVKNMIASRALPAAPWKYTDDTMMALSIFSILRECGRIDQDRLADSFVKHYNGSRGYGPAMDRLIHAIKNGESWRQSAAGLFQGKGSYGNGAAMRVAPLGAYFADDIDLVVEQAALSAVITHCHNEAVAGAVAVAVAAAWAWRLRQANRTPAFSEFLELVIASVPESEVKMGLLNGTTINPNTLASDAAELLGNGTKVTAQDTVPFALWCASKHLDNYEEALWFTVDGDGDRDTTCAIVGGIVGLFAGDASIPSDWLSSVEPIPDWIFQSDSHQQF